MKNLIIIILTAVCLPLCGQISLPVVYSPTALTYTNAISDNVTNGVTSTNLDMTRYEQLAVQIRFQMADTPSVGIGTFYWKTSLDRTNWPDHYSHVFRMAGNGTNYVVTNLTMEVQAMGYLRLEQVGVSSNGWALTNLSILYTPKPYRRERI